MDVLGPLALLAVLVGVFVFWLFFAYPPAYADKKQVSFFNKMILSVCALFIIVYIANIAVFISGPQLATYRAVFIVIGSFGIEIVMLVIFFLVRNFFIFRPRNRRW